MVHISHIAIIHIRRWMQKSISEWISLQQELIKRLKTIVLHTSFRVVSFLIKPMIQFNQLRGGERDTDCLRQHFIRANYLTYLVLHPLLKKHPSPIGHGWELVDGNCHPVRHTRPALPAHLPTLHLETAEKREETNMRRLMKSKKKEKKIQSKVKKNGLIWTKWLSCNILIIYVEYLTQLLLKWLN